MSELDEILASLFEKVKEIAKSETVVGQAMQLGESWIVPVSKVKIGFLIGSNKKGGGGAGASGGAITVEPVGLLVVSGDGKSYFWSVKGGGGGTLEKALEIIPDVAQKLIPQLAESASKVTQTLKKPKGEEEKK